MKNKTVIFIITGVIVALAAALIIVLLIVNQQPDPYRGITPLVEIAEMEAELSQMGGELP